ncbi:MAG: TonB-dependent receptor, partial [Acidobacteriota bacterium]
MVTKTPALNKAVGFSVGLGMAGMRRFSTDINTPVRFLGERTGFRTNLLWHESGVAGRDVVHNQRWGLAPTMVFGSGTPTRFTVGYQKLRQDNIPDYGIPWVTATQNVLEAYRDRPAPVPRETFYGLNNRDFEKLNSDMGTARIEHEFSDTLSLRNQFRFGRTKRDSAVVAPRFASNDSLVINRGTPSWVTKDDVWDNQTDMRASFSTGGVQHAVVGGAAFTRENNQRVARTAAGMPTTTLFNPNPEDACPDCTFTFSPIHGDATANTQAAFLFDTVKLHRKFELNGGVRWERFDTDGINSAGAALVRNDKMASVRAAAIYKPMEAGSIYFSYGTSMNPSLEGVAYSTANTAIEPEKTYTTEAGTKWELLGAKVLVSGAIFHVEKTNARTPGVLPDEPAQVLQGNQRVNGAELGITGNITRNLRVFGAYTLLDSEITKSNNPLERGKEFINTPRHSVSMWSSYSIKKLTFGGGVRFIDSRFGNNTNTRHVDSYWTLDALAQYSINKHLDLRMNLYNLNDAYYFERLGGGHLVPGAARSAMVTTNFHF